MKVDANQQPWQATAVELARALLSLADTAEMPDSYWQTDSRVAAARRALGVGDDERYSRADEWAWGRSDAS